MQLSMPSFLLIHGFAGTNLPTQVSPNTPTSAKMRRESYTKLAKKKLKELKYSPVASNTRVCNDALDDDDGKDNTQMVKQQDKKEKELSKVFKQLRVMTNEELEDLLSSKKDDFLRDMILDQLPTIKKLQRERDHLKSQVINLASFNYAREPEFVKDRKKMREKLDEVADLRRQVNSRSVQPLLDRLSKSQGEVASEARKCEEESEKMAQAYLGGTKSHDEFIGQYIELRKQTSHHRTLADKFGKECARLANLIPKPFEPNSPIPTPRQRKRLSLNTSVK